MKMSNPLSPSWLVTPADVNEVSQKVWPSNLKRRSSGELEISGISVSELASQFGTPLYVIDEADFRARAIATKTALETATEKIGGSAKIYYASKAFLTIEIVRWIDELGLNLDVSSGGELAAALAGGLDPSRIGLHGNNKSIHEIGRAVTAGVSAIVIDSELEIERIAAAAGAQDKIQPVRLRINTGVHADTHDFLATASEDQKFGIAIADAPVLVQKILSHSHLRFLGLHQHVGSQIFTIDGFAESTKRLVKLHAELSKSMDIPELNLGGGFGVNYKPSDAAPNIEYFAEAITKVVAEQCQLHGITVPNLAFEPGRYIAGPAGITLYNVGTVKDVKVSDSSASGVRKYVSVDGGMSDNLRAALYEAEYHTLIGSRSSAAEPVLSRVVGKHCESGDIVVRNDYLPADVQPNDLLAVATTGAYCYSMSSNYNFLTKPAVVAVRDGKSRVLIRAEVEADLFSRDLMYQQKATKNEKG